MVKVEQILLLPDQVYLMCLQNFMFPYANIRAFYYKIGTTLCFQQNKKMWSVCTINYLMSKPYACLLWINSDR